MNEIKIGSEVFISRVSFDSTSGCLGTVVQTNNMTNEITVVDSYGKTLIFNTLSNLEANGQYTFYLIK